MSAKTKLASNVEMSDKKREHSWLLANTILILSDCPSSELSAESNAISRLNSLIKRRINVFILRQGVLVNRKVNIPSSLAGCLTREQTTNILSQPHFLSPHPKHIFSLIPKMYILIFFSLSASKLDGECIYTEQCQHHDQNAVCSEVNTNNRYFNRKWRI